MSNDVLGYSSHDWRKHTDDAVVVDDKGAAHITLSHKKGYKQGDANTMFTKPDVKVKTNGYVEGKVKYYSYE